MACKSVKSTMKTSMPKAICLMDYSFECLRGFYLISYANIYVSFEGLPETSEEGLTLELSAFETL